MSVTILFLAMTAYFLVIFLIAFVTGKKSSSNDTFFTGNHRSPWWVVSIGMIGASISGVSFVSVPGMVGFIHFGYLQMVMGFFIGYVVIAEVLLPLYYRLNLISIYTYLSNRFGKKAYKTGSAFFILSKLIGASARLYIAALILQKTVLESMGVPFVATVTGLLIVIWLYTYRAGVKTIIWTDTIQALIMISALVWMIAMLMQKLEWNFPMLIQAFKESEMTKIFVMDDWSSKQLFWKQLVSGALIAIVMTGLDQDMMQKNLSCRNLKDARKNVYWYGFSFIPVNFLFLMLGFLLLSYASQAGITLPSAGDDILPFMASNHLGAGIGILFVIGILAAALSSADSALTALTTAVSVDFLQMEEKADEPARKLRLRVHFLLTVMVIGVIMLFHVINDKSVIDAIYTIASYTYGPLLGMFSFGLMTRRSPADQWIPYIAVASPLISEVFRQLAMHFWKYQTGYELLLLNGMITFAGLWLISTKSKH